MSDDDATAAREISMTATPDPSTVAGYALVRKAFDEHEVRQTEVPTEHFVSLPLPTLRWGVPAFAGFACPAVRIPRQPLRLSRPDHWWALTADARTLVAFGLVTALPFAAELAAAPLFVDRSDRTIAQLADELQLLEGLMDEVAGAFLTGRPAAGTARADTLEVLTSAVTPAALPWSAAMAPDFLAWLAA